MKKIAILVLIVGIILTISACTKKQDETGNNVKTIKIGYLPITHALPLFVQNETSTSTNYKIELVKFGSWPELVEALNAGEIDGASMLVELAMKAKEQGIDVKSVALGHRDGNVVIVANDIKDASDLKGKTVSIPSKLSSHNILLYQLLKENNLKPSDVNVVELPPPEMPAALSEGRISAYIVAEPFGALSVSSKKGKVLATSQEIWQDSLCCTLVLSNDFINENNSVAKEFVTEYVKSADKAELKDEDVFKIASKYMNVPKNVLSTSLKWISYKDLAIKESEYKVLTDYLKEMGLSENPPSYEDFVDTSLIKQLK